jgi:hypothetical protein
VRGWRRATAGDIVNTPRGGINVGAQAAIAIMRKRERDIRRAFQQAGALDPASACHLDEIGVEENRAFSRLKSRDVIRESSPGAFHFDEEKWQSVRSTRLKLALSTLAALLMLVMFAMYAMSRAR